MILQCQRTIQFEHFSNCKTNLAKKYWITNNRIIFSRLRKLIHLNLFGNVREAINFLICCVFYIKTIALQMHWYASVCSNFIGSIKRDVSNKTFTLMCKIWAVGVISDGIDFVYVRCIWFIWLAKWNRKFIWGRFVRV